MVRDEHEMLVEYSEMTAFDFNSKEFKEVRRDYIECKDFISKFVSTVKRAFAGSKTVNNY